MSQIFYSRGRSWHLQRVHALVLARFIDGVTDKSQRPIARIVQAGDDDTICGETAEPLTRREIGVVNYKS